MIEPSFGIGRILYCLFEHSFYVRSGAERRAVFRFRPGVAPVKATFSRRRARAELNARAAAASAALTRHGLHNAVDTTGNTIGKRYARTDELGVPFAVTIDYQTLEDDTATLRERDSTAQVRVPVAELGPLLRALTDETTSWDEVAARYPAQAAPAEE